MLESKRVEEVFVDCLFKDGEDHSEFIKAEGVVRTVGFHPGRLSGHIEEIREMLMELPVEFMKSSGENGGGWTFLNACNDKDGRQWTGSHLAMEQLFQLGIGIGLVECCLPRVMWPVLPGGVPYYTVDDEKEAGLIPVTKAEG